MRSATVGPEEHDAVKHWLHVDRVVRQLRGIHPQNTTVSLPCTYYNMSTFQQQLEKLAVNTSDSTGTDTGTVLGQNNVASVWPRNIFCSGVEPCEAFLLDI